MSGNRVKVAGVEVSTDHWIGGKRVASKERFADFSPIDGSHLADVSAGGKAEADAAVVADRSLIILELGYLPEAVRPRPGRLRHARPDAVVAQRPQHLEQASAGT